jgi:hypothetical protein
MIPITRPVRAWARSGDFGTVDGLNIGRALCCSASPLPAARHQVPGLGSPPFCRQRPPRGAAPYPAPGITVS